VKEEAINKDLSSSLVHGKGKVEFSLLDESSGILRCLSVKRWEKKKKSLESVSNDIMG
jgi:hypothetical protein